MKIAIAQLNSKVGDVPGNLKKTLQFIETAKKEAADWVIFPELQLVGYPPRDLLDYPRLQNENAEALERVKTASVGIGVIVGWVEKNPNSFGKPYFNSAAVFRDGKCIFNYHKQLLPSYDVFEDERFFEAGSTGGVFEWAGKKYGIAICEDIWNQKGFLNRNYPLDPMKELKKHSPYALFVLSASPFYIGKPEQREKLLIQIAKDFKAPVIYCNQVAGNDEVIFDGGSLVASSQGKIELRLPVFEENLSVWSEKQNSNLASWPLKEEQWLEQAISFGLRDYVVKSGLKKVCLGLSGGIDSSVLAVIATRALGKENVEGISLPTRFTSSASREDAQALAKNLGISFRELAIEDIFLGFEKALASLNPKTLTLENIQPRIRMTLLMAIANEGSKLLLNTSNKSEIATGYSTLYGDSAGALSPLGDLTKAQIVRLANHFNERGEVIPQRVITRPPTAELRENQKDEDTLPPYETLDLLVDACFLKGKGPEELIQDGFSPESVETFSRLHRVSEYKRRQMPPVLKVSAKAFGMGRRMPLACRNYTDK